MCRHFAYINNYSQQQACPSVAHHVHESFKEQDREKQQYAYAESSGATDD